MANDSHATARQGLTLGRARFAKISAVEGLALSPEARREFQRDDKLRATAAERRQRILAKYSPKK